MTKTILQIGCAILAVFLMCRVSSPPIVAAPIERKADNGLAEGVIVSTDGDVSLKRERWTAFAPAAFGTTIDPGDLLRVAENSHAKVVCSDLTLRDVSVGTAGIPCSDSAAPFFKKRDGSLVNATRSAPIDPLTPMVLSPRRTKLLSRRPTLRWSSVPGVTTYRVMVRGGDSYWTVRVSSKTELIYPETAPKFQQGVDYKLIVEAGDRSSSAEPGIGLGFSLLESRERQSVVRATERIRQLGLAEEPTRYLIARLYAGYGLNAEAIQLLDKLSADFKAPAVSRLLGDLYRSVGLIRQAETSYLTSLSICKAQNDEEGEMLVHLALASIYEDALGNSRLARDHLGAAITLANTFGDKQTATLAKKRLVN